MGKFPIGQVPSLCRKTVCMGSCQDPQSKARAVQVFNLGFGIHPLTWLTTSAILLLDED